MSCWALDEVRERAGTEFERDVEEVFASLLVVVSDDIGVVVGFFEEVDFALGESYKVV